MPLGGWKLGELVMTAVEPGKWYLSVECQNPLCKRGIVFQEVDHGPPISADIPQKLQLTCPHCEQPGQWDQEQVRCSQARQKN